jgi:hypothetical protein
VLDLDPALPYHANKQKKAKVAPKREFRKKKLRFAKIFANGAFQQIVQMCKKCKQSGNSKFCQISQSLPEFQLLRPENETGEKNNLD